MKTESKPFHLAVFSCCNTPIDPGALDVLSEAAGVRLKHYPMACSSMVKDVFLLRAFEAGADAVVVLVCPEGTCRYVEGNVRAEKRVQWVRKLLDEIGLDGRRLALYPIGVPGTDDVRSVLQGTLEMLAELGRNPAA